MTYKEFRRAIDYLLTPGAEASFYGLIGEDGLRREAVTVSCSKTDENIGEFKVRVNYEVLKELDRKEAE